MNNPAIEVRNLSITLSGVNILKGVSLDIDTGEYSTLIGPNGAGKTTLIKCMAGIYKNWKGSIRIGGAPLRQYGSRELAKRRSYVPQASERSAPFTVEQFVAMGRYPHGSMFTTPKKEDRCAVHAALERTGLNLLRCRAMNTLSGGERQMAFIAAALAQNADILLLDEPSAFLDYSHRIRTASLLQSLRRERTITILAAHHDVNAAMACSDRIYAVKNGSLCFSGTPVELGDPAALNRIYDTEFKLISSSFSPFPLVLAGDISV